MVLPLTFLPVCADMMAALTSSVRTPLSDGSALRIFATSHLRARDASARSSTLSSRVK